MHVYLSTSPRGDVFTKGTATYRRDHEAGLPHFVWENITYGDFSDSRVERYDVNFPEARALNLFQGFESPLTRVYSMF